MDHNKLVVNNKYVYTWKIKFFQGDFFGSNYRPNFNDIHAIGTVACNNHWFDVCLQWYRIAKSMLNTENVSKSDRGEFFQHYKWAVEAHDKYLGTYNLYINMI